MIDISILRAMANAGASTEVILAAIEADNALNDIKPVKRQRATPLRQAFVEHMTQKMEAEKFGTPVDYKEQFWAAYPRKIGKGAALAKLTSIMKRGDVSFDTIMSAVKRIDTTLDKQFIPHPITWLNQGRWDDVPDGLLTKLPDPLPPKPGDKGPGGTVRIEMDSEEWNAWRAHLKTQGKPMFPNDRHFGWFAPSQWPPGHDKPLAATNGI